ncbi:hypothetical protein J2857_003850 [Neorhizobium galegae]|uniref:hypothetical protein n=1 Tax=Neorhizobium galegae TaxID=399 RepID=UPI001AE713C9|nr:hypothetical protein [Neorhizobium galegae]MBP2561081.1 hypothetical protein [Neorhizobium galegae]
MSIFDEREVEAGHHRLASAISAQVEVLVASTDLLRKALLHQDVARHDPEEHADYLAASQLGFRIVNQVGAATKLLDCGYFVQAAGLLRDIAEIGMLALYFTEIPEDVRQWRKLSGKDQWKKFSPMKLNTKPRLKGTARFASLYEKFHFFSDYGTHPSSTSIIAHHDGNRFHIGPHVNAQLYINTYSDLANLTWHTTDACGNAYFSIFSVSAADLYPKETQRFIESWNGIAPPLRP